MKDLNREQNYLATTSMLILAASAVGFVLHYSQAIMIPFIFAIFIVQLVSPILDYQVIKLKFSRQIAIMISLLLVIVMMSFICILLINTITILVKTANSYTDTFITFIDKYLWKSNKFGIALDNA